MNKEAYYFSHDSNARNDVKVVKLRRVLGLEGYAIYFCLIEILREQKDHKLPLNSISDIAFDLRTSEEKVNGVISGFDLFLIEEEKFFSARLLRSMSGYNDKKKMLSESAKKGNSLRWGQQEIFTLSPGDGDPIALKEIKEKEINTLFYTFWGIYDYKVGKSEAIKAFFRLSAKDMKNCIEETPKWLEEAKKEPWRRKPYPSTFLNQKRWEDESGANAGGNDDDDEVLGYTPQIPN